MTAPAPLAAVTVTAATLLSSASHPPSPEFLTAAELQARWKVSVMFLWRLSRRGRLPKYKLGARGVRYALADIERIEQEAREPSPEKAVEPCEGSRTLHAVPEVAGPTNLSLSAERSAHE